MISASIIVPCYNEEATIHLLLEAIYNQTYPKSEMEVIISDGLSSDGTREEIRKFEEMHSDLAIRVVDNTERIIPSALNRAIKAATGKYIIRLDAHCVPEPDYVSLCVSNLKAGNGDNVGGVWEIRPGSSSWISQSIAKAAAHPLGVGDARYRYGSIKGEVDTVPFGSFEKSLFERIGFFDESLLTNEDYEFNVRINKNGGRVWMDPSIRSIYYARTTISGLAKQYWRYGFWKAQMLTRYPDTIRWRQALPPFFILSIFALGILSLLSVFARYLTIIELGIYLITLLVSGLIVSFRKRQLSFAAGIPLAIITMHFCWGSGFLWSLIRMFLTRDRK
jgi:succinoglycan biosynthesis protein ExoA